MTNAVDLDDPTTWPGAIRQGLSGWAAVARSGTATSDLDAGLTDAELFDRLDGRPLRAYHCTRLLPHEVSRIQHEGLHALSADHVTGRIAAAYEAGALTRKEATMLAERSVYLTDNNVIAGRDRRVCLVVGLATFDREARGLRRLLSTWGGEAIYWHVEGDPELGALVRSLGVPSIVVVDLPLDAEARAWPALAKVFTARIADLPDTCGEIHVRTSVPASSVLAIWQPGDPRYDRFRELPGHEQI